jgi:mRNA interferase MazF
MTPRVGAPDRGDVVWWDLDPHAGPEQAGRRPGLVVSPRLFNAAGLLWLCPITNQRKGYPFEVALPAGGPITGVVLVDQLRTIDWQARRVEVKGRAPADVVAEVLGKARAVLA